MNNFNAFLGQIQRDERRPLPSRRERVYKAHRQITSPGPMERSLALPQTELRRVPAFSRRQFSRPMGRQEILMFTESYCPARGDCPGVTKRGVVLNLHPNHWVEVDEGLDEVLPLAL
jgi:hypothetical protein